MLRKKNVGLNGKRKINREVSYLYAFISTFTHTDNKMNRKVHSFKGFSSDEQKEQKCLSQIKKGKLQLIYDKN